MEVLISAFIFFSSMCYVEDEHVNRLKKNKRGDQGNFCIDVVLPQSTAALVFTGVHKAFMLRNCVEGKTGKIPRFDKKEVFEVNTLSNFVHKVHCFYFRAGRI